MLGSGLLWTPPLAGADSHWPNLLNVSLFLEIQERAISRIAIVLFQYYIMCTYTMIMDIIPAIVT